MYARRQRVRWTTLFCGQGRGDFRGGSRLLWSTRHGVSNTSEVTVLSHRNIASPSWLSRALLANDLVGLEIVFHQANDRVQCRFGIGTLGLKY